MNKQCTGCVVSAGTHKPAEALHQIDEKNATLIADAKRLGFVADQIRALSPEGSDEDIYLTEASEVFAKCAERIAELEAQLDAIGAGGVEPLRKPAAAPPAVQAAVPEAIEQMAVDRYKVVPSHESMFHRWAVVAGNGTQQLYNGREGECQNMARKFMGAFLDGSFVAMQNAATAHPAEEVPTLNLEAIEMPTNPHSAAGDPVANIAWAAGAGAVFAAVETALATTQPAAQGMDARDAAFEAVRKAFCKLQRYSFALDSRGNLRRCADHCGNWVEFEAVHTLFEPQSVDAAIAAQAKQGGE